MKEEITTEYVLDLLEKPIVEYVQGFMERAGMKIDKEGAENIVSNVGVRILQKKKVLSK